MSGHHLDPRATPIKLSLASIPKARSPLPQTWARYIPGDYPGLYALAGQLYQFGRSCNMHIVEISANVNRLIAGDDPYYSGASTKAFKASYGQDAVMMNGLGHTVVAMANVIDTLAHQLAQLEAGLEADLQMAYDKGFIIHDGLGPDGPNFKPNPTYANSQNKALANGVATLMNRLQRNREVALVRADDYRKRAATALAVLNHSVASGFRYYLGQTGVNGTLDPGGLLLPNQLANDKKAISRLESQLAAQEQELSRSGIDLKTVVADLQQGGGSAKQIADILSKFKGFKGAQSLSSLLREGGGTADELAALILDIGGFAALIG